MIKLIPRKYIELVYVQLTLPVNYPYENLSRRKSFYTYV